MCDGQSGEFLQRPDHRVERVGDADHEGVRRVGCNALAHGFHHLEVDAQQIVTAHPRLARHAGGDDADVGACDVGIGIDALQARVEPFDGAAFGDVEGFALRRAFGDIEKNDVAEFLEGRKVGERATDLSGADEGYLGSGHERMVL